MRAPGSARRMWLIVAACVPLAVVCALVPLASLRGLAAPTGVAVAAAVLLFPVLPVAWHLLAERRRASHAGGSGSALERLALRSLAVGLLVLMVAFSTLGPRAVGGGLGSLLGLRRASGPLTAVPRPTGPVGSAQRHELERFIPADASLVVALSGASVMQQLLGSLGADTGKTVTALQRCQILTDRALVLIAVRDAGTRLVVVRAPGITDQRNLYCVVGFLGGDQLGLKFTSDKPPVRFELQGLSARALAFEAADGQTVVAAEGAWQDKGHKKLFPDGADQADGALGLVLGRIDRGAGLWAAGVTRSEKGPWDLAIDARFGDNELELRGSSVPPSGEADRADLRLHVPLAFASALPQAALQSGLRGVVAAIATTGAQLPPAAPGPQLPPATPGAQPGKPSPARPRRRRRPRARDRAHTGARRGRCLTHL
jgi:hypothetical protein